MCGPRPPTGLSHAEVRVRRVARAHPRGARRGLRRGGLLEGRAHGLLEGVLRQAALRDRDPEEHQQHHGEGGLPRALLGDRRQLALVDLRGQQRRRRANDECRRHLELPEERRHHSGGEQRQRRGEVLRHAVGILRDHGDDDAAAGLARDGKADDPVPALVEAVGPDRGPILRGHRRQRKDAGVEGELRLLHPEVLRLLQPVLEVHAGEAAGAARNADRRDADEGVLAGRLPHLAHLRDLHQRDAHHEEAEARLLREGEGPPQDKEAEHRRGQQLGRIGHLVDTSVQIRQGDIQQVLLHDVEQSRHGHQQAVAGDDMLPKEPDEAVAALALALLLVLRPRSGEVREHDHGAAQDELGHLVRRHGGGCQEHGPIVPRPRVPHKHHQAGVLQEQAQEAGELHAAQGGHHAHLAPVARWAALRRT
mmetsp:Transcript_100839/g.282589  ORF Transcript_100839/g.282589 Transcript_100839/m.282589 type:complete len:422 (-) Transcript_100839:21-1286(-)